MRVLLAVSVVAATLSIAPPSDAAELSFERRVAAQEALQRVYHAHRLESTSSFEETVPRAVIEEQVRDYRSCLDEAVIAPPFAETTDPAPGEGLFYLVQGRSDNCGTGELGSSSNEQARVNLDPGACP